MSPFESPFTNHIEQPDTSLLTRNIACDLEVPLEKETTHELRAFRILEEMNPPRRRASENSFD